MERTAMISVYQFCEIYQVELNFVSSLHQHGLIELISAPDGQYFSEQQLADTERFVRLHHELDINIEGIEAIGHLLQQIAYIREQNTMLQNRLNLYENPNQ